MEIYKVHYKNGSYFGRERYGYFRNRDAFTNNFSDTLFDLRTRLGLDVNEFKENLIDIINRESERLDVEVLEVE